MMRRNGRRGSLRLIHFRQGAETTGTSWLHPFEPAAVSADTDAIEIEILVGWKRILILMVYETIPSITG